MGARSEGIHESGRGDGRRIDIELLRFAQRNNWPTMMVQLAASIGVYFTARDHAPDWYNPWIAVVLSISAARIVVDRVLGALLKRPDASDVHIRAWGLAHSTGLLASALLWSIAAWQRLPVETTQIQFTIIVVISALVAGASGVLAPLLTTGRIYICMLLAPACAVILMSIPEQTVLGVLGLIFMLVILGMHRNNHAILRRSIYLGRENLELVDKLQAQNLEMAEINRTLEHRVVERTEALQAATVEAQAANRLKSEFLATISHEIRTPLNAVLGMAHIMERGRLERSQRARLSVVESAAQTLLSIFNDVLDISRIESRTMEIVPGEFRLDPLVEGLAAQFRPLALAKGLAFDVVVAPGLEGWRVSDEARLRQILSNLTSNAVKFTDCGFVRIEVSGDAERLLFRVIDSGPGIAPEARSLIFERFVQVDGSNTRRFGGLGMGLALSRGLADRLGCELTLEATSDQGSCFLLSAPLPVIRAQPATARAHGSEVPRILVVDDNEINRQVLMTLLTEFGLEGAAVQDGAAAVEAWAADPWDAILMDINMPVMDGVEATRAIRAGEAARHDRHVPIIAVTASATPVDAAGYRAAGMDEVLPKPIDAGRLLEALNRHLHARQTA